MKIQKFLLLILIINIKSYGLVDFFGNPFAITHDILGVCNNGEKTQYVEIGWFTNFETNNNSFQIQRSKDNWSTFTAVTNISGCGTCGTGQYNHNDYGPFVAGDVWNYRIRSISNFNVLHDKYADGTFTVGGGITVLNWINQVSSSVILGSSPNTESSYNWSQVSNGLQGVTISLVPTEINKIYLEENNNKLNFDLKPISSMVSIDVNIDNGGYFNIYSGSPKTNFVWHNSSSYFLGVGLHNLKLRFISSLSATIYYREYDVYVVPKSDGFFVDNYCNTMRVWKGNDPVNGTPLILSEGFDSYNSKAEQYYREAGKDLISCLHNKGFNIYVINYYLNSQSIKNNAAIFSSAIRYVSNINNNILVVATGISMGGLINRYACAKAENDANPLPISKFVTLDAPHQGAFISDELQKYIKQVNYENNDAFADVASNNDAAKELLNKHAFDPTSSINSNFFNNINSLNGDGYPHLVPTVGVAFSTNQVNPASEGAAWLALKIHTPIKPGKIFNLEANEVIAGSFLPKLNKDPFIAGPGKFWALGALALQPLLYPRVDFIQSEYPSFIPHNSALDLISGVSKFNKTIITASTAFHDEVPNDLIEPLVNAIVMDNVYIQNKNYSYSRKIIASQTIYAGNNVTVAQSFGNVNILPGVSVTFKAAKEIQLKDGFSASQGSEFIALIEDIKCDGSNEYQNRINNNSSSSNIIIEDINSITKSQKIIYNNKSLPYILFPNPTNESFNIAKSFNELNEKEIKLEIIDASGTLKKRILLNNFKSYAFETNIDIDNLNVGFYIVNIFENNLLSTSLKLIKQ